MPHKLLMPLLCATLLLPACALNKPVPVAVSCPQPPAPPPTVEKSVTTAQPLTPRYELLIQAFRNSLGKATLPY